MTGAGRTIKAARPDVRIVATEPAGASLLKGDEWNPHKIQGWTPDFIPDVLDRDIFDELMSVTDERAIEVSKELAARGYLHGYFGRGDAGHRTRCRGESVGRISHPRDAARYGRALSVLTTICRHFRRVGR